MNKEELFQALLSKISQGEISKEEVLNRLNFSAMAPTAPAIANIVNKKLSNFSVTKLLYILGAIISVVGILLFAAQIWDDVGSMGRILITLGMGLLLTLIGSSLIISRPAHNIGPVFYAIGGILIPGGVMVALSEFYGFNEITSGYIAVSFCLVFAFYLLLDFIHKHAVLTFFAIANGTVFLYSLINAMTKDMPIDHTNLYAYLTMVIGACYVLLASGFREGWNKELMRALYFFGFLGIQGAVFALYTNSFGDNSLWPVAFSLGLIFVFYLYLNLSLKNILLTLLSIMNGTAFTYVAVQALIGGSFYSNADIYNYLTMIIGATYLLLSHSFRETSNKRLSEILNFFGSLGLLGASFSQIYDSFLWQMFFFVLVMGGFAVAINVRSRSVLIMSTLFLLAYVSYITSEYFTDSLGWPISLVILGFVFIGLGYLSININKKYISS